MDQDIETGTNIISSRTSYHREKVDKVLKSNVIKLKSYIEPVEKVIDSSSNIVNSYKQPVNNVLETTSTVINSYKEPLHKVMESGSNMIKQPVEQILVSSTNLLSSNAISITNNVMNVPVVARYLPWLFDNEQHED